MSVDIVKQLDRAKRYVEKNRLDDAIESYQAILTMAPNHLESIQALADLYARVNRPDRASFYYGMLFDRPATPQEEPKALALYTRFLKPFQQPPERVARYATLLQKLNRPEEAIDQFLSAGMAFELSRKGEEALACFERIAQLDPENRERHIAVAELAERLENPAAASRGYLRAGQLTQGNEAEALDCIARAHHLMPRERSAAMLYAQALLRKGDAEAAVAVLAPLAATEQDPKFLGTYADAMMRSGQLESAGIVLELLVKQGAIPVDQLFSLTNGYFGTGLDDKAIELLASIKKTMMSGHRESEFAVALGRLTEAHPKSLPLAQFSAAMYSELNREAKYFDALIQVFDLYLAKNDLPGACDSLEKLIDIDSYDFRNQQRMDLLEGRADAAFLSRLKMRLTNTATHGTQTQTQGGGRNATSEPSPAILEDVRGGQTLEDLLVQAEIFVQYSLQSKAIERLQKIAELFPGEELRNERLQSLFETAHWWPQEGVEKPKIEPLDTRAEEPASRPAAYSPETLRDLGKISEINQNVFRQPSPRAMLSVAVNEVGNYMHATRCLAVVGTPGHPPQMASEYCASGIEASSGAHIVRLLSQIERAAPDALGGFPLEAAAVSAVREMGLESVLAVQLTDPETQMPAGMLVVGFATPHIWKPNETYFLQSIGDQMLLCVHHTRLRSLVRTLAVSDEKTGFLTRASYIDCLLRESQHARMQGTPLTLALLQIDDGPELLRQQGEAPFEHYMEQLARAMQVTVRQTDFAVKYTSWALAFILPDTTLSGGRALAEKLKKMAVGLRPPWEGGNATTSVAIVEAITRRDFDSEDIVTDLINRAESGLEEARKRGGDAIISLEVAVS